MQYHADPFAECHRDGCCGRSDEKAISRPAELMEQMRAYVHKHEAHLDGESSSRVLDAVNNYIWYFQGKTRTKPWNLVRKFKLRWRVGYPLMATLRLW